jgi:SPP1 gp7 family putative phage head morphogenesis protein
MRADQLAQNLLGQFDNLLEYQARRIARTETAKAQAALTQTRAQNLGINWYVWRTVRDSHRHMEGVLVPWGNPPNPEALIGKETTTGPYHAGNTFNCRCYAEPLIDIDWLEWPHKVYIGGAIQMMNRDEFAAIEADPSAYNSNEATQPEVSNGLDTPNKAIISNDPIENALNTQKGNPMETTEANVGTNPNFNQGMEYKVNCQRCVPAFELRKRGFDVTAKPKPPNNMINTSINCFDASLTWTQGRADLMKQLNAFPDGARFGIRQNWKGTKQGTAGHTYVAVKENGVIRFIDPQTASLDCSDYLSRVKRGTLAFFRMDNIGFKPGLDLNDIVEVVRR